MLNEHEFIEFFSPIWGKRYEMSDGHVEELKNFRNIFKNMPHESDFTDLAKCVNESLEKYGYPPCR